EREASTNSRPTPGRTRQSTRSRAPPRSAIFTGLPYGEEGGEMNVTRRQLLMAALAASRLRAASAPVLDRGFGRVTQIAEGVYATIADGSKGPQCASNGGIIAGREALLIVEGHMEPA